MPSRVSSRDVPLYVESGVADLGLVGKDVLLPGGKLIITAKGQPVVTGQKGREEQP